MIIAQLASIMFSDAKSAPGEDKKIRFSVKKIYCRITIRIDNGGILIVRKANSCMLSAVSASLHLWGCRLVKNMSALICENTILDVI